MFSEIDLISSYHYIDELNSINIKHLEMFPVGADFWFHKIYKFNGYKWLIKMKNEVHSLKSRTRWITEKCFLLSDIDMLDKV